MLILRVEQRVVCVCGVLSQGICPWRNSPCWRTSIWGQMLPGLKKKKGFEGELSAEQKSSHSWVSLGYQGGEVELGSPVFLQH